MESGGLAGYVRPCIGDCQKPYSFGYPFGNLTLKMAIEIAYPLVMTNSLRTGKWPFIQ
jgi:hypothetical protein